MQQARGPNHRTGGSYDLNDEIKTKYRSHKQTASGDGVSGGRKVVDLDWTDALMLTPHAFLRKARAAFAYGF
jgi:hypothetical protein